MKLIKMVINPNFEAELFWREIWSCHDCPREIKIMVKGFRTQYILSYSRAVVIQSWAQLFKSFYSETNQPALVFIDEDEN